MATDKGSGLQSAIPAIVAIAGMLATGLWLLPDQLGSTRPKSNATRYQSVGEQDVEARLWADPFRAVYDFRQQHPSDVATAAKNPPDLDISLGESVGRSYWSADLRTDSGVTALPADNHSVESLRAALHDLGRTQFPQKPNQLLILPVLVRGEAYAEDAENRLRTRYALLAALNVSGYVPEDGEHIGFFTAHWLTDREVRDKPECAGSIWLDVPYEWFTRDALYPGQIRDDHVVNVRATHILVLWLDDAAFSHRPLVRLSKLLKSLAVDPSETAIVQTRVRMLGPPSSTSLREILKDPFMKPEIMDNDSGPVTVNDSLRNLEIFSYLATAVREALSGEFPKTLEKSVFPEVGAAMPLFPLTVYHAEIVDQFRKVMRSETVRRLVARSKPLGDFTRRAPDGKGLVMSARAAPTSRPAIFRTTVTDDAIADQLIQELNNRGIVFNAETSDAKKSGAHVVLVSEWDTFYGRAVPLTFDAVLRRRLSSSSNQDLSGYIDKSVNEANRFDFKSSENLARNVFFFSYLRGMDGAAPGSATDSGAGGNNSTSGADQPRDGGVSSSIITPSDPSVRPDGTIQFDYARRMAAEIVKLDKTLRENGRKGVGAVGILGSDVYDKLLILRALRSQLPDAYFFTTVLDNRLLDPSQLAWTQGLLIGSGYGLRLADWYQQNIPPFRDSHQTSLFLSGLIATGAVPATDFPLRPEPRLFEVGRNGAIDLSDELAVSRFPSDVRPSAAIRESGSAWLHPPRHTFNIEYCLPMFAFPAVAIVVIVLAMFAILHRRIRLVFLAPFRQQSAYSQLDDLNKMRQWYMTAWSVAAIALVLLFVRVAYRENLKPGGEPVALISGVSLWPTEFLRLSAFLLTGFFLIDGHFSLLSGQQELAAEFELDTPEELNVPDWFDLAWQKLRAAPAWALRNITDRFERIVEWKPLNFLPPFILIVCVGPPLLFLLYIGKLCALVFVRPILRCGEITDWAMEPKGENYDAANAWNRYQHLARWQRRLPRVLIPSAGLLALLMLVFELLGKPLTPWRSTSMQHIDSLCLLLGLLSLIVINCFVIDSSRLCKCLAEKLRGKKSTWTVDQRRHVAKSLGMHPEDVGDWLDIQLIARRSQVIVGLVFQPFIILSLMIASRLSIFDRLGYPPPLIIAYFVLAACSTASGLMLRRAAELTRSDAITSLRKMQLRLMNNNAVHAAEPSGDSDDTPGVGPLLSQENVDLNLTGWTPHLEPGDGHTVQVAVEKIVEGNSTTVTWAAALPSRQERATQVAKLIEEIEAEKRGAFAPFSEQPVVAAVLLQTGGLGIWTVLEHLSAFSWS